MRPPDVPPVSSLKELFEFSQALAADTLRRYEQLEIEMKRCHNPEVAALFNELADLERGHSSELESWARDNGVASEGGAETDWRLPADNRLLSEEIAENLYLMTSYRALRLAVYNRERAFDYFSQIAAATDDVAIREKAEALAHGALEDVVELRLRRRQAYRSRAESLVGRFMHQSTPASSENMARMAVETDEILISLAENILTERLGRLPAKTETKLNSLLADLRSGLAKSGAAGGQKRVEAVVPQTFKNLFSALRNLLRELEITFDLFMEIAETSQSEEVVKNAQDAAQQYIRRLALVRDAIDDIAGPGVGKGAQGG